ncbi:MAG: hypothetical protein J6Y02_22665 [Pseudobutyrivibrio sp.]|nr:hypothetical protein [Pseudobutyrivibrio sp.]
MAWFNAGLSSNSGGASSFNELDDVSINTQTLSNGQVPVYNSTTHKWENGEQSGGSSGHTIIDDGGTSLTQRDNLQFKGAYSEDNSANGKTVVNVVRSMTKAQFDQLTNNEKTGFINITDITGGNDDRFQPVIYSTDEREIGVWTDGKPLYEKTYHQTSLSIARNTELTIDDFTGKFPISCHGVMYCTDGRTYYPSWAYGGSSNYNIYYKKKDNGIFVLSSENDVWGNTWGIFTTVRYTKDSDTEGSGQWTPQGVPAHHYSTDEQVVGTWIDGSTLYEKVFNFGSEKIISRSSWTSTTITGLTQTVDAVGIGQSGSQYPLMSRVVNNTVDLLACRDGENAYCYYVYLRYTKSST